MQDQIYHIFSQALVQFDMNQVTDRKKDLNPWTANAGLFDLELICQYERICMDYSLSGTSNKLSSSPSNLDDWLKESHCWTLLNDLLCQRRAQLDSKRIDNLSSNIFASDSSIVNTCLEESYYYTCLREAITVKNWLERIAPEAENEPIVVGNGIEGDPDAWFSPSHSSSNQSLNQERSINSKIFSLFRRGDLMSAIDVCRENGQFWKAAALQGGRLFSDTLIDLVKDELVDEAILGNQNIAAWKGTCLALSKQECIDIWEKATYSALAGDLEGLIPICHTWYDYMWAYYNSLIEYLLLEIMKQNCISITQPQDLDIPVISLKLSEKEIFERLTKSEVAEFSKDYFFQFQMHFILNTLGEFFDSFSKKIDNISISDLCFDSSLVHHLRFLTHVVLVLRSLDQDFWTNDTDAIIVAYTKVLAYYEKNEIVALYLSFLPANLQIDGYSRFLQDIISDRRKYYINGRNYGLDVLVITSLVVGNVFQKNRVITDKLLEYKHISFVNLEHPINEHDKSLIQILEWLSFDRDQKEDFLKYSCLLARHFFRHGKINCVQELFQTFPLQERNSQGESGESSTKCDEYFEELTQFAALLDCFVQVGIWETMQAQKSQLLKSKFPEVIQIEDKMKADSERCLQTIENLLSGPLFGDTIDDDPYNEILIIRGIYVPYLIDKMHLILSTSSVNLSRGDLKGLHLAELVAGSSSLVEALLFSKNLDKFLYQMQASATEAFGQ